MLATAVDLGNALLGDVRLVLVGLVAGFALLIALRRWLTSGWALLFVAGLAALFLALSLRQADFRARVLEPDNVAILLMLGLTGCFTWLGLRQATANDRRVSAGRPPAEVEDDATDARPTVWRQLLYPELICALFVLAALIAWSLLLNAPLEAPADPTRTPNPAKAPWYFLGLQELLVYFPPWIAGVLVPGLILFGLAAIPYLDRSEAGRGHYSFAERRRAVTLFLFGFLVLWVGLLGIGTFLRGPNWDVFGPYEAWDALKVPLPAPQRSLGEAAWNLLGGAPASAALRELPGVLFLAGYFLLPPLIIAWRAREFRRRLGWVRFLVFCLLLLALLALPLKMLCYHALGVRDFVAFPGGFRI